MGYFQKHVVLTSRQLAKALDVGGELRYVTQEADNPEWIHLHFYIHPDAISHKQAEDIGFKEIPEGGYCEATYLPVVTYPDA